MPFDLMSGFNVGQEMGKAKKSSLGYAVDTATENAQKQMENQMKLQQQIGLFKGEEQYKNQNDPTRLEANAKLNRLSNPSGSPTGSSGAQQNGSSSTGVLGTNVLTKSTNILGDTIENQQAQVSKDVAQKQLDSSSSEANQAALMMQKLDEIRTLHDKALSNPEVHRATTDKKTPFAIGTRMAQGRQALDLAKLGPDNPDWQNYLKAKDNFSFAADRGLFGEKGKLISQQLNAGTKFFAGSTGTKQGDYGLFKSLYSIPLKTIDYHNNLVSQYGADPSLKVQPNSMYAKADAMKDELDDLIKSGKITGKNIDSANRRIKETTGVEY